MSRVLLRCCAGLVLLGGLAACDPPAAPEPAAISRAPREAARVTLPPEVRQVRVALTPYMDPEAMVRDHEPFRAWLQAHLGVPVTLAVAPSYDGLTSWIAAGEVDVGAFSPYAYVRARSSGTRLRPIVTVIAEGSPRSAGYIVVRDDSLVQRLEELRGKRVAFVDPASASGWLMSSALLLKRGIHPARDLSAADFLGNHQAALDAVLEGRYEAAAVYQGALDSFTRRRGLSPLVFRIVGKTERMPRDVYAVRQDAPEALADALATLLSSFSTLNGEGRRVLAPMDVNGFVRVQEDSFDGLVQVERAVSEAVPVAPGARSVKEPPR